MSPAPVGSGFTRDAAFQSSREPRLRGDEGAVGRPKAALRCLRGLAMDRLLARAAWLGEAIPWRRDLECAGRSRRCDCGMTGTNFLTSESAGIRPVIRASEPDARAL